jgi:acetyltransferase
MMMTATTQLSRPTRPQPVRLPGGERVRIRPLRRDDAPAYESFVRGLSAETLYNRLLGAGLVVTPEGLEHMIGIDQVTHVALVATVKRADGESIVGVARYALELDPACAELAVTVADDWQGKGVGRALLGALVRRARKAGVRVLFGDALPGNAAMLGLMVREGFHLASSPGDAHLTRGTRLVAGPRRRRPSVA